MLTQIDLKDINITGGYFKTKQDMNRNVTIPATYKQFHKTGRIDAVKLGWRTGQPDKPHIFWDSDIAKWIEGAAYVLLKQRDEDLEKLIDTIIDDIAISQMPDGYFNSYYQAVEYSNRFTNRHNHELYCAGHLLEGAIAYKQATDKGKMLDLMIKYIDLIYDEFMVNPRPDNFKTPGHQEIELALVKLYHETGNKKYLDLSEYFIGTRGTLQGEKEQNQSWASENYAQDHLPVEEQSTAEGHAVRCLYMFAGAADIARECGNDKLKAACGKLFDNVVNKRMYVTGGIGGNYAGEAFSYDYDLPNEVAYTETCASIAMVFFAQRMYLLTGDKKYTDCIELQIYNAIMSGISLGGDKFFYCNPLEVHPERRDYFTGIRNSQFAPEYERPEYFGCSCCPPNVIRLISSLGQYMYHYDGDKIYINLYNTSEAEINGVKIIQTTDYPYSGKINIKISTDKAVRILLRIPSWCEKYNTDIKSGGMDLGDDGNGYLSVKIDRSGEYELILTLDMQVTLIHANPKIHHNAGRAAVKCGPVVYCAEGTDNGSNLKSAVIKKDANFKCEEFEIAGNTVIKIICDAIFADDEENNALYSSVPYKTIEKRLTLIPYSTWANRGKNEMIVWLLRE